MSKLDGETRCICKGQVIEEGSSLEEKNPYDPKLLAYPMEGRPSGQMILYWYFHAEKSMEILYAADPFSHLTPGLAPGCFYTVGGTRNRETGWLQNCLLIIDFERASCEVLAQDTFLLQIKPDEDGVYFLNADKEIRKISQ